MQAYSSWACCLLIGLLAAGGARAQDDFDSWVRELHTKADDADPALIPKVAAARTRDAAVELVKVYDQMQSILMRREIVRALAGFDGVAEAERPALEKLANVAGSAEDAEVRDAAIAGLSGSARLGRGYLKQLVDSTANDQVREQALRAHVKGATAEDAAWYRYIWNVKQDHRKNPDGTVQGFELGSIRELAFAGLRAFMTEEEFIEALRNEVDPKIRRAALQAMHERNMPKTSDQAQWLLERVDFPGVDRAVAAKILVDREGAKAVPVFLELAKKRDVTTEDLRQEMARLIVNLNDEGSNKKVEKLVGKGKPHEMVFALEASVHLKDPKLLATIRKQLKDKVLEVRYAAALALGQRRDGDSLPDLRSMLEKPKLPGDARIAVEAISLIEQRSTRWLTELVGLAKNDDRDVRNAALEQLVQARRTAYLPVLAEALQHEDWSTRMIAVDGLLALRDKQVVPMLIARLEHEKGRVGKLIGEALWQLTGQPFQEDFAKWQAWWAAEGEKFTVITPRELEEAEKRRETARLKQRTRSSAQFFGIRVESHRVIFIIDVSGSMLESVYGRTFGKWGTSRIDVAKQELSKAIEHLAEGALFNVFAFADGIMRWQKENIGASTAQNRQAALQWVDRLGAMGGTNLYDTVKMAFEDPDVDTIFVMSDGEPTVGAVIDPHRIREDVAYWNKHRKIKINTVAIGSTLEVLEWLAADSGGTHVKIR